MWSIMTSILKTGADVTIIAGCGIHGEGCSETRHDGIHTFHVGKGCNVKYVEKPLRRGKRHRTESAQSGDKDLRRRGSVFTLEDDPDQGLVDSTERENYIELADNAKLFVTEKLMTDDGQTAVSNMDVELNGADSSARIVSRSVGKRTVPPGLPSEGDRQQPVPWPMYSAIPLSWMRRRSVPFRRSTRNM